MKHLFFVFSHITFYLAKSIQKELNIPENKVIYLTARNYKNPFHHINSISIDKEYNALFNINEKTFYKGWKYIAKIDALLKNEINAEFELYIPHLRNPLLQIIATNNNCKSLTFFEEGSLAYHNQSYIEPSNILKKIIRRFIVFGFNKLNLYGLGRYYKISHYDLNFFNRKGRNIFKFFTIHDLGFRYIKDHPVYKIPFYRDDNISLDHFDSSNPCLIFDAWRELKDYSIIEYSIRTLCNDFHFNKLNIKFHPEQNATKRKELTNILSNNNIDYSIIADEVPLEQVFAKTKNLTVIGYMSSLLYYADMLGHNIISLKNFYKLAKTYKNSQSGRGREPVLPKSERWLELYPKSQNKNL